MIQRRHRSGLTVTESYERTRLGPQYLIAAYDRVVPVQRKPIQKAKRDRPPLRPAQRQFHGGEHV